MGNIYITSWTDLSLGNPPKYNTEIYSPTIRESEQCKNVTVAKYRFV